MSSCPTCQSDFGDEARFCPHDGSGLERVLDGRYLLGEVLGVGAMGTVTAGCDQRTGRAVAVKRLHPHLARDSSLRCRFEREAKAVAALEHPGIVRLLGTGIDAHGCPYLVMERVSGGALSDTLGDGPLPRDRALLLARHMAEALAHAHERGVVHRDLKLSNILAVDAGLDAIKVVDFGIAKLMGDGEGAMSRLTRTGMIFGTPETMAPEQALGGAIDHRVDLYALGVILFRLLTGEPPFMGQGMAMLLAHVESPVPDPRDRNPEVPEAVAELLASLLAKDPEERPASAQVVVERIDAILAGARFRQTPCSSRSRRATAGLLACVAAGAAILLSVMAPSAPAAMSRSARSERPEPGLTPLPSGALDARARQAVVASVDGFSVRVLVPEDIVASGATAVVIDLWDESGQPASAPLQIRWSGPGSTQAPLAAQRTDMPGRYQVTLPLEQPGTHRIEIGLGAASMSLYLDAAPADPMARVQRS